MKFVLPIILMLLGIRVWVDPVIVSRIYRSVLDLSGVNGYIGAALFGIGFVLLLEALGVTKRR